MYTELKIDIVARNSRESLLFRDFLSDTKMGSMDEGDFEDLYVKHYPKFLSKDDFRQSIIYNNISVEEYKNSIRFYVEEDTKIELKNYNNTIENFCEDIIYKLDISTGYCKSLYDESNKWNKYVK